MYSPAQPLPTNSTKRRINLKPLLVVITTFLVYIITLIISGFISLVSENIQFTGLNYSFDPIITIAYILVFYSVSHYYSLTKKQAYNYLLLALFLSFTINFVEGSLVLVSLAPVLRKLKLIETAPAV